MTVRGLSLAFIALWLALGVYFAAQGVTMKLGTISSPGTGFMPFFIGLVLIFFAVLSAVPLVISLRVTESERLPVARLRDPAIVVVAMIAYALALERAGFIACTIVLILLLAWVVGRLSFVRSAVLAVLATLFCSVLFGSWLGVRLP